MALVQLLQNLTRYNYWANSKISDWLMTLDQSMLIASTPSSFESIDKTLQHVIRSNKFWYNFISEEKEFEIDWEPKTQDPKLTINAFTNLSSKLEELVLSLTSNPESAEEILMSILVINEDWCKKEQSRYDYICHVLNHNTYHRGQIITMARSLGVTGDFPATDYCFFAD